MSVLFHGMGLKGGYGDRFLGAVLKRLDSDFAAYAIVSFGLMLRIAALSMVGGIPLHNESPGYHGMALQLLHGEHFAPYWPPGVPYFLWLFHKIFGEGILVARASNLPVYVGFSVALYSLVKEISTRRAANLAALIFALYPPYIRYSFNPSTEYPAAACMMAIVYFGILAIRKSSGTISAGLGIFLGALTLIRPSSLLLIILAPLYLFLKTRKVRLAALPLLVSLVLISAWLWKAHAMTGRFVMINDSNWENFFLGNNPYTPLYNTCAGGPVELVYPIELSDMLREIQSKPQELRDGLYRGIAIHYIISRPDLFLLRTFNRFRAYFGFPIHRGEPFIEHMRIGKARDLIGVGITILDVCFYWPIMALAILYLFNFRNSSVKTDSMEIILGAALAYALPNWISCSQPRYNFPVVPLFGSLAAMFLVSLLERSKAEVFEPIIRSVRRRHAMVLALAVFFYVQIEWALVAYLKV